MDGQASPTPSLFPIDAPRDRQRLNLRLAGHRFLFDSVAIGTTPFRLERVDARVARDELRVLRADALRAWKVVLFNSSVQDRLDGVGVHIRAPQGGDPEHRG